MQQATAPDFTGWTLSNEDYKLTISNAQGNSLVPVSNFGGLYLGSYLPAGQYNSSMITTTTLYSPMIYGTDIPIFRVAALFAGESSIQDVRYDFPTLSEEQLRLAQGVARDSGMRNVSYPKYSLKRLLLKSRFADLDFELKSIRKISRQKTQDAH